MRTGDVVFERKTAYLPVISTIMWTDTSTSTYLRKTAYLPVISTIMWSDTSTSTYLRKTKSKNTHQLFQVGCKIIE